MFKILCVIVITVSFTYGQESLTIPSFDGCIPNKEYKVECNSCLCSPEGKLGACTLVACPHGPEECKPGDTKSDGCASCFCFTPSYNSKSVWACTSTCEDDNLLRTKRSVQTCRVGDFRYEDCNPCTCTEDQYGNTSWSCARMFCLPRRRRDVNVGSDFKDTPCAPNDFFQLPNCITCYCNSAKTGYLCSDSVCSDDNNSTESSIKNLTQSSSLNLDNSGETKSSTETSQKLNDDVTVTKSSTETPTELQQTIKNDVVEETSPSVEN